MHTAYPWLGSRSKYLQSGPPVDNSRHEPGRWRDTPYLWPWLSIEVWRLCQSGFLVVLLQSYSNYPPVVTAVRREGVEADGSTDMSPHPTNSIWLRLSIVRLSNPTNCPMSSKEIFLLQLLSALHTQMCWKCPLSNGPKWCQSWNSFWKDLLKPRASKSLQELCQLAHTNCHCCSTSWSESHCF